MGFTPVSPCSMADFILRVYNPRDLERILDITVEAFDGVSIDQNIAKLLGANGSPGWEDLKRQAIREDIEANPDGIFVAEIAGEVVGYITTRINMGALEGRIPNLAVDSRFRGLGIGRALIQKALDYFRSQGLRRARIETLEQNEIGRGLYPKMGFKEVARQIHYAMNL